MRASDFIATPCEVMAARSGAPRGRLVLILYAESGATANFCKIEQRRQEKNGTEFGCISIEGN
jgi:hypothetical protein